LERKPSGAIEKRDAHDFAVVLGSDFPFEPPSIIWQTPIFHPNFDGERVCLGTIWFGGSSIADLCVSLRRLITLEDFNVFDPLDGVAAEWLRDRIRTDRRFVPLSAE
jgi:ubiquitin-conjugating enzyme E2 C